MYADIQSIVLLVFIKLKIHLLWVRKAVKRVTIRIFFLMIKKSKILINKYKFGVKTKHKIYE